MAISLVVCYRKNEDESYMYHVAEPVRGVEPEKNERGYLITEALVIDGNAQGILSEWAAKRYIHGRARALEVRHG